MTKNTAKDIADEATFEILVAEEDLILQTQMLIIRLMRERKVNQKILAERLGVRDSYVSQMLGDSPRNLTLRTIARVMHALGTSVGLAVEDELDQVVDVRPTTIQADATTLETDVAIEEHSVEKAKIHVAASVRDAAVTSHKIASAGVSVWDKMLELPKSKKSSQRSATCASAYAEFDSPALAMAA